MTFYYNQKNLTDDNVSPIIPREVPMVITTGFRGEILGGAYES